MIIILPKVTHMKSPSAEGVISILVQIIIYCGLGSWFYRTNFFEGNKVKIYFQVCMVTGYL